jgi:serine/threonine-protein kinase/endoribonuclease IRE1
MQYVHGDLNPLNVIISQDQRIKLSDSCLSKFSYTKCPSNDLLIRIPEICKRKYWLLVRTDDETNAELIENPLEDVCATEEDDIFAAGCLIFYFLTKGLHPFGDVDDFKSIEENVKNKNPINLTSKYL